MRGPQRSAGQRTGGVIWDLASAYVLRHPANDMSRFSEGTRGSDLGTREDIPV